MVRVALEFVRHDLQQAQFYLERIFSRRQTRPVADAKQMRVDSDGGFTESIVQNNVRCLAADAGQRFQRLARVRDNTVVLAINICDSAMTFFALLRYSPMLLINSRTRSSPSATIFSGVSASGNRLRVAL